MSAKIEGDAKMVFTLIVDCIVGLPTASNAGGAPKFHVEYERGSSIKGRTKPFSAAVDAPRAKEVLHGALGNVPASIAEVDFKTTFDVTLQRQTDFSYKPKNFRISVVDTKFGSGVLGAELNLGSYVDREYLAEKTFEVMNKVRDKCLIFRISAELQKGAHHHKPEAVKDMSKRGQCSICSTDVMLMIANASCRHNPGLCRNCLGRHITHVVQTGSTSVKCPVVGCSSQLSADDVQQFAPKQIFEQYSDLLLKQMIIEEGNIVVSRSGRLTTFEPSRTVHRGECSICFTDEALVKPNAACRHHPESCRHCVGRHITHIVYTQSTSVKCPVEGCSSQLSADDVQQFAPRPIFEQYSDLLLKQMMEEEGNIR